jgi:gamma-glutamyltranspeptidase / glutathione hydrolase
MLLMLLVASGAAAVEGSRYEEGIRSRGGVISTESPAASEAGLEVLDAGGSAMDAAVTMTFALGVARPQSCGIGGGGFLVYRSADGETAALDFRERPASRF